MVAQFEDFVFALKNTEVSGVQWGCLTSMTDAVAIWVGKAVSSFIANHSERT